MNFRQWMFAARLGFQVGARVGVCWPNGQGSELIVGRDRHFKKQYSNSLGKIVFVLLVRIKSRDFRQDGGQTAHFSLIDRAWFLVQVLLAVTPAWFETGNAEMMMVSRVAQGGVECPDDTAMMGFAHWPSPLPSSKSFHPCNPAGFCKVRQKSWGWLCALARGVDMRIARLG